MVFSEVRNKHFTNKLQYDEHLHHSTVPLRTAVKIVEARLEEQVTAAEKRKQHVQSIIHDLDKLEEEEVQVVFILNYTFSFRMF